MSQGTGDLSLDDKLDLFCDYLDSDEWIFPIQSFIDYYCVVFSTEDPQENFSEKQVVFKEYKEIVCQNIDEFLKGEGGSKSMIFHMCNSVFCCCFLLGFGISTGISGRFGC